MDMSCFALCFCIKNDTSVTLSLSPTNRGAHRGIKGSREAAKSRQQPSMTKPQKRIEIETPIHNHIIIHQGSLYS